MARPKYFYYEDGEGAALYEYDQYSQQEYPIKKYRRRDEAVIPARAIDLSRLTEENKACYPFDTFLRRPANQFAARNFITSARGNFQPTNLRLPV